MPIDSVTTGANVRQIMVLGDPATANNQLSIGQFQTADGQSLSAAFYSLLVGAVPLLDNASGTFDRQRSAVGTTGVAAVSTEGTKTTYSASVLDFTPPATATDFWQILGSSTKTVRVSRITISGYATSAATIDIQLVKRTTASTGGSPTAPIIAQHDSNDSAATAVVNSFGANPSPLGTTGGIIRAQKLNLGAAGAAGSIVWDFSTRNGKAPVLRGVAQQLSLSWNGAAVPSGTTLDIDIEFTEE